MTESSASRWAASDSQVNDRASESQQRPWSYQQNINARGLAIHPLLEDDYVLGEVAQPEPEVQGQETNTSNGQSQQIDPSSVDPPVEEQVGSEINKPSTPPATDEAASFFDSAAAANEATESPEPKSGSTRSKHESTLAEILTELTPDLHPIVDLAYGQNRELKPEEMEELRNAFASYARKGSIKCVNLGDCMRTMGYMPTEMELIELSQQINMNLGGRVEFEDFVDLMGPKLLEETADMIGVKELRDAFNEFDANGDGLISTPELREAMKKLLGQQIPHKELEDIVHDIDLNGDGRVDFEEFVRMVSR
ncbi:calcium-binding protein 1b isoform X1 [Brachyhypopomus gauderio]|uniref:calcium-binding protein 1b isoform X1 n=1 Tax=Brachyhypopomus gauderio TaxID=698409 RepID=UPI00404260BA